jgi:hypothetical protein
MYDYSVVFLEDNIFNPSGLDESSFLAFPQGKSQRYLYVVRINGSICTKNSFTRTLFDHHGKDFYCAIPSDILDDVRNNKCKIVFDYTSETNDALGPSQILSDLIRNTSKQYSLRKRDIMLCTGNLKSVKHHCDFYISISNFYFNLIAVDDSLIVQQRNLIENKVSRDKKCLCLMRKPRLHRLSFAQLLFKQNLLHNNIVTMSTMENHPRLFGMKNLAMRDIKNNYNQDFINSLPWTADSDRITVANALMTTDKEKQMYLDTSINFIIESNVEFDGIELDITEKVIKPIVAMQPFVLLGQQGSLNDLKQMGYKTFDHWWDESYDSIPSSKIRMHYVADLFKHIQSLSNNQIAEMHYDMLPTLEHNLAVYKQQQQHYLDDIYQTLNAMFDDK